MPVRRHARPPQLYMSLPTAAARTMFTKLLFAAVLTLLEATLFHRQCLLVNIVKEGISRLATKSTRHSWKVWRWPNVVQEFMTQRSFR